MARAKDIKESLLKQIEIKGAKVEIYTSLVDDYMWFWKQEREMQQDIKNRGRTYTAVSAAGREYEKNNPSVKDALMYSKQMVAILDALGLSTKTVTGGARDDADADLG
jgi:phage terminase small subunit